MTLKTGNFSKYVNDRSRIDCSMLRCRRSLEESCGAKPNWDANIFRSSRSRALGLNTPSLYSHSFLSSHHRNQTRCLLGLEYPCSTLPYTRPLPHNVSTPQGPSKLNLASPAPFPAHPRPKPRACDVSSTHGSKALALPFASLCPDRQTISMHMTLLGS